VKAQEPVTPQDLLLELKEIVQDADDQIFKGYIMTNTRQLKNALTLKIDAAIKMLDGMLIEPCRNKLRGDISPKLTNPWNDIGTPSKRAQSWLELYSFDSDNWRAVTSFATQCQQLIDEVLMD
jgi:hypothetical protein